MFKHSGVGTHCFAGGFTMGMRQSVNVPAQLEIHNFGRDTALNNGIAFKNFASSADWPKIDAEFCFGNPRCNSFSSYSSGCACDARGSFAPKTQDIHDIISYGLRMKHQVIIFESVQQIMSVGSSLLKIIAKRVIDEGYRVAHLKINAASFGNAQRRKRYFFVAYKADKQFNIIPPVLPKEPVTVRSVICTPEFYAREDDVYECRLFDAHEYTANARQAAFQSFDPEVIAALQPGECLNLLWRRIGDDIGKIHPQLLATVRRTRSQIPFSLHCLRRLHADYHCPVLCMTSCSIVHPTRDRTITVGEGAALMGWPDGIIPSGPQPFAQIGKGIVPAVGKWLGEQVSMYLDNFWGTDDFDMSYDKVKQKWVGEEYTDRPYEKLFDLTAYEMKAQKPIIGEVA